MRSPTLSWPTVLLILTQSDSAIYDKLADGIDGAKLIDDSVTDKIDPVPRPGITKPRRDWSYQ